MPGMETLSIPELRDSLVQLNTHEQLSGVKRTKIQVPVANGTETWIYTPIRTQGPLPYIFYVHGGGFVGGNISVYDPITTDLVLRTRYSLIFPQYKLAPEAQWPAQQEQYFNVLEWTVRNRASQNLIPNKFAIMGDSAAGVLILNMNIIAHRHEFWGGPYLTGETMRRFADAYLPASVDRASELVSLSKMSENTAQAIAPTLIITSSADILRDEAEELGEKLQKAGRDVAVLRAHGQIHDSAVIEVTRSGPTPKMVMTLITASLKQRLG
ncbi:hypothetical protein PG994_004227 [Apiospora phragmitis]|uniref:Alpha/beta hydrolase fold-3 domain-containing protein n=1 Tax=Apiospora phragmitis TaxID=2905665 RepID=A0ABR1VQ46_9PEZI